MTLRVFLKLNSYLLLNSFFTLPFSVLTTNIIDKLLGPRWVLFLSPIVVDLILQKLESFTIDSV